jgi:hypothetical protein
MNTPTRSLGALALLAALAAPFAAHAATNLVANGSFEQGSLGIGSFTGWATVLGDSTTFVDSSGQTGPRFGQAGDGLWAAYFGSTQADGGATISQSLATTPNQRYVLTFDFANDNGGAAAANALAVDVGGVQLFAVQDAASQDDVRETLSFTATGASTLLSFFAFNDMSYVEIDDVGVTAAPVPEPGAARLMLAGLLMTGAWVARRRRGRR